MDAEAGPSRPLRASARVPLTIICGFLGAGKSTLLKYALHHAPTTYNG